MRLRERCFFVEEKVEEAVPEGQIVNGEGHAQNHNNAEHCNQNGVVDLALYKWWTHKYNRVCLIESTEVTELSNHKIKNNIETYTAPDHLQDSSFIWVD